MSSSCIRGTTRAGLVTPNTLREFLAVDRPSQGCNKCNFMLIRFVFPCSRHDEYAKARTQFKTAIGRNVDWPEFIWTAWITFEDYYGTAESLNAAKARVGPLQEALAAQRMQVRRASAVTVDGS